MVYGHHPNLVTGVWSGNEDVLFTLEILTTVELTWRFLFGGVYAARIR